MTRTPTPLDPTLAFAAELPFLRGSRDAWRTARPMPSPTTSCTTPGST
ncbi:MAG: hypothetical protein IPK74_29935 [Deltaproteobacteria bacterium]|nr:hypothetical protein [Deltaproteobacteria bacterium]